MTRLPPAERGSYAWLWVERYEAALPHRWLCTWHVHGTCDKPARWGRFGRDDGPLFCDEHKDEALGSETCVCRECGHEHQVDVEPELYPDICPECGSDDTGRGIHAYYCDTCGASWMADAA